MKIAHVIALLLLLVPLAWAQDDSDAILDSTNAITSIELGTNIQITAERTDYSVSYLQANISMVPRDYANQDVVFTKLEPPAKQLDSGLLFEWRGLNESILHVRIHAEVSARHFMPEITEKISFPLTQIDEKEYTLPTKNIDSDNREIIKVASDLAAGEDDLYKVVVKLAEWTNENVNYNLSTLTEGISQPASWVLVNRRGVCDDISVLFIAFNRALGIPARFVSGAAYTNSPLFSSRWGFHGWAEVYFQGYGWVPFDVTYGEYGYIDAGHIRFLAATDPEQSSTRYEWKSRNAKILTSEISVSAEITQIGAQLQPDVKITAAPFEQTVGFGSYNAIEAEITNLRNYYVTAEVIISRTAGLEIIGAGRRAVLLKPMEKRRILFIEKTSNSLSEKYEYTFPITIAAENTEAKTSFRAISTGVDVPLEKLEELQPDEEKNYNPALKLNCSARDIYTYETANITCEIANLGNVYLEKAGICIDSCKYLDIGIGERRRVNFIITPSSQGRQRIDIIATADEISSRGTAEFTVLDMPEISIGSIETPERVKFGQKFNISFTAKKKSLSEPRDVKITLDANKEEYKWLSEDIKTPKNIILGMNGNMLKEGNNEIIIKANYLDANGRAYEAKALANVTLEKLNILQKIISFFLGLFR